MVIIAVCGLTFALSSVQKKWGSLPEMFSWNWRSCSFSKLLVPSHWPKLRRLPVSEKITVVKQIGLPWYPYHVIGISFSKEFEVTHQLSWRDVSFGSNRWGGGVKCNGLCHVTPIVVHGKPDEGGPLICFSLPCRCEVMAVVPQESNNAFTLP